MLAPLLFFVQLQVGLMVTPWYVPAFGTLGALLAVWAFARGRGMGALAVAVLLTAFAGFQWFVVLSSRLPAYAGPVEVGKPFPAFQTTRADGSPFTDADLRGQATALVFYRGRWCTVCMAELRELEKMHDEFAKRKVRVAVVSPETKEEAAKSKTQFPDLTVIADSDYNLIKSVGVVHDKAKFGEDSAMPTTILVDKDGVVRWIHRPADVFARMPAKDLLVEVDRNLK